jgi:uncharacterized flavoprotein (TIGR03862 family)
MENARAHSVAVVGGGPGGLRAAEILAAAGCQVAVYDQKPSVGRKFLVAGRGGLNLTHWEPLDAFAGRYRAEPERWSSLLAQFGPQDLRDWAASLGVETYVGTSKRVFPVGQQAAVLLRRWVARLRELGVVFHVRHRLEGAVREPGGDWRLNFGDAGVTARAVILALGGASWPQTGSDGHWTDVLRGLGIAVTDWQPANCGFEAAWDPRVLAAAEGCPLKNVVIRAGDQLVAGEAMITRYGLEGGAIYQLGQALRQMRPPRIEIDLKPASSAAQLLARLPARRAPSWPEIAHAWKLNTAARALLEFGAEPASLADLPALAALAKALPVTLIGPRPLAEAISSAGGVEWGELDKSLMLRGHPGMFLAGEMIDWEAPTGGYLLQGCLATGTRAASGVLAYLGALSP